MNRTIREPKDMRVALTGGIGSGKSYVCRRIAQRLGVSIYDCDAAAKRLMRTSPELRRRLTQLIGPEAYLDDGPADVPFTLNKAAVARFLLASEANAQAVDAIVHPAVARDFLSSGARWMECAILYESGFDRLVDRVVVVSAPDDVRVQRVMQRDGISREKAQQWLARQWPQTELLSRADYEIKNDGVQPLEPQIENIIRTIEQCNRPF